MSNTISQLSDQLAHVVAQTARHAVAVEAGRRFAASGFFWKPDLVVTSEHTTRRDDEIVVTLPDGTKDHAKVHARDTGSDIAVLRLSKPFAGAVELPAAAHAIAAGQLTVVVGRSADTGVHASLAMLSAIGPAWRTWRGGKLERYVRLDTGQYPGTSGALVVDANGAWVGMANTALSRIAALAVDAADVRRVVDQLVQRGGVRRGFLGAGLQPVPLPQAFGIQQAAALIVLSVEPDGPAARAGLLVGDLLVSLDGTAVADTDDVLAFLEPEKVGRTAKVRIVRGGEVREIAVTIGERQ